jgi:hypothetical protein
LLIKFIFSKHKKKKELAKTGIIVYAIIVQVKMHPCTLLEGVLLWAEP